jgi:nucleoside-diphosphate-sugar epimerase
MSTPTILLTGATGFIGGAVLARLLELHPDSQILLLVRDRGGMVAADRIQASLARFVGPERAASARRCYEVLNGDMTDSATFETPRLDEVTHVLHLGSNTNFRSVRGVRYTNIIGALTLAHRMRRVRRLQRFVYVGTSYICGECSERIVFEDMFPRPRARHFTEYTASKAECEMLLERTAPDLPWIVARPSVVVGHTRLGCLPSASLFWFYRTCDRLRRLTCPLDSRDDVVPVDWVAEALRFLLFKSELRHQRYHVSAGDVSSVTWTEIAAALARCYGERPDEPYQIVDIPTIVREGDRLRELLGPEGESHLLAALPIYYRFMEIEAEIFDNKRLLEEGMAPAPRFTSYLDRCATLPSDRTIYHQFLDDL